MTVWFLREIHPLAKNFLFTEMDSEICTGTSARNIKHTQKNFESEFDWGSLFAFHLSMITGINHKAIEIKANFW